MNDGRPIPSILVALFGMSCANTITAHRPLSDDTIREANEAIEGKQATAVLFNDEQERVAHQTAQKACRSAPGKGSLMSGERCLFTHECECGLICKADRCQGTSLKLSLVEPGPLEVSQVKVARDSTQWLEGPEARSRTVPNAALERVTVLQRGRGALEGLGIGSLTGLLVGGLIGAVAYADCSEASGLPCAILPAFAVLSALPLGAVLGILIGGGLGDRTTIEFDDSVPPPPPPALPATEEGPPVMP